jgi:RimJ/RimL family protein N-acetyltransferase
MLIFAETPDENALMASWIAERIPAVSGGDFGLAQTAGVVRDGVVLAGVAFHEWQPDYGTLQLSMAADSPAWASRAVLCGLFRYAFVTAKANKLWTATPANNLPALSFNERVGMKREATLRHHFGPKKHAIICSMLRAEWRRSPWKEKP